MMPCNEPNYYDYKAIANLAMEMINRGTIEWNTAKFLLNLLILESFESMIKDFIDSLKVLNKY